VSNPFIVIGLQEGTQKWREWRHNGIGASDAPVIMGESRLKNSTELLEEKCGPAHDFGRNDLSIRGIELEAEARQRYMVRTGQRISPACIQSSRYDWLRASVDGLSHGHDSVVEITCGKSIYWRLRRIVPFPIIVLASYSIFWLSLGSNRSTFGVARQVVMTCSFRCSETTLTSNDYCTLKKNSGTRLRLRSLRVDAGKTFIPRSTD
jgi:putative phage-type endonuclease